VIETYAMQELLTYLACAAAVAYLIRRKLRRRATGNCCGEKECPAAKRALDDIRRATRR